MRRHSISPRPDYRSRIEEVCLAWHDKDDYWNERCYYEFTRGQVVDLENATNELHARCLDAVQFVIDKKRYAQLAIPDQAIPVIERSWEEDWPSVYGRFDLAYDGVRPPRLLEYNADTPTALLETAVVQWYWLQDVFPANDQFNSLHERLVAQWRELTPYLKGKVVHFCSVDDVEDGVTVTYLADTAVQAGLETRTMPIDEIGWDGSAFLDSEDSPLRNVFKLYPWEFMFEEEFFAHLTANKDAYWLEPPWKAILSSKGILPILHEMFPYHPNLLPAYADGPRFMEEFVQKPLFSREGEDVTILRRGDTVQPEGHIFQEYAKIPEFEGRTPVVGSWIIGGEAAGIGIRESSGPVTDNLSHFIPHCIRR